jgi:protein-disulfide isomerase
VQAAEAAEAAGAQNKFWQMHGMLFEHQDALDVNDLLGYAEDLGLDVERFSSELETGIYEKKVRADFHGGVRSGVNGTPTFFINGARYDGDWLDLDNLVGALEQAAESNASAVG